MAWNSALTSEMIATQPVIYELERLKMPVLFLIGDKDTTGRSNRAPREVQATLGNFPAMSEAAKARIPTRKLVRFADMGHSPQIQDPARFHKALLEGLLIAYKCGAAAQARNRPGQAAAGLPMVQCRLKP